MTRFASRAKKLRRAGKGWRQAWVVLGFAVCLGAGVGIIKDYAAATRDATATAVADDAEIYTGSILYFPDRGSLCRQLLFDNQNGQFSDNGYVDCARAAYHGAAEQPKQWSAARVRVISTGFRAH